MRIYRRCANHMDKMGPVNSSFSFITISHEKATYEYGALHTLPDQISVRIPLNQNQLGVESSSKKENIGFSSSQFDLPLAKELVACTLRCYSSCLGQNNQGRAMLIVRLEAMTE